MLNLNLYQWMAQKTAVYPGKGTVAGLEYCALGFAGEAGEVANKVKKILRDDNGEEQDVRLMVITPFRRAQIIKEAGGALWYLAAIAQELGVTLNDIAELNLDELQSRRFRGTIKGDGDNR